jgi:hypothetical protein
LGDQRVNGRKILKWALNTYGIRTWTGLIWLSIGSSGDICEYGNKPSGFIISEKFND